MFCSSFESTKLLTTLRPWVSTVSRSPAHGREQEDVYWFSIRERRRAGSCPRRSRSSIASGHGWASAARRRGPSSSSRARPACDRASRTATHAERRARAPMRDDRAVTRSLPTTPPRRSGPSAGLCRRRPQLAQPTVRAAGAVAARGSGARPQPLASSADTELSRRSSRAGVPSRASVVNCPNEDRAPTAAMIDAASPHSESRE